MIDQMKNLNPRLTAEDIVRRSDEGERERVSESMRRYLLTAREDREERKRLLIGTGWALLIVGLAAVSIYAILQLH